MINREISTNEVITVDDWLEGSIQPTFIRQQEKFKDITISVIVSGDTEEDAIKQISWLTAEFRNGILKFDDVSLSFKVTLNGSVTPNRLKPNVFEVEYSLKSSYGLEEETVINKTAGAASSFKVINNGTAITPCIIELMPLQKYAEVTITGLTKDAIKIKNLVENKKIIIDGEKNIVTEDGLNKFKDTDMWEFPYLEQGENTIRIDKNNINVTIKYRTRFI